MRSFRVVDEILPCEWDLAEWWMRSCRVRMRSSWRSRASDCQFQSPSILRHSGIWGAAHEAVLLNDIKKNLKIILFMNLRCHVLMTMETTRSIKKCLQWTWWRFDIIYEKHNFNSEVQTVAWETVFFYKVTSSLFVFTRSVRDKVTCKRRVAAMRTRV